MTKTEILQILSGFAGSIGFCILFNIRGKRFVATAIGGGTKGQLWRQMIADALGITFSQDLLDEAAAAQK